MISINLYLSVLCIKLYEIKDMCVIFKFNVPREGQVIPTLL